MIAESLQLDEGRTVAGQFWIGEDQARLIIAKEMPSFAISTSSRFAVRAARGDCKDAVTRALSPRMRTTAVNS